MTTDPFDAIGAALSPAEPTAIPWEKMDVRERARNDPLSGCPMRVGEEMLEPGSWKGLGYEDDWTGLPPQCPVVPLGRTDGTSHFLNAMGDIASLKDSSSGKGPIGGLFAGRSAYLEWAWPRFGKARKGETPPVVGWDADDARQALVDACAYEGAYDPDLMHGRGAWRDDAGKLAYHAGDRVWIHGKDGPGWTAPGRHDGWIYPTRPRISTPWPKVVPGGRYGPAEQLRDILNTWNWRRKEIDPHLLVGWACMAMVAGALDWRAMVFITAEKGSGKSTLLNLLRVLFGRGFVKTGNTTGAYLYQKLGHDCIPVVIDELEAQAGNNIGQVMKIIELIRTASSGDKIGRGSSEGVAREFECRSAFVCTSINIPPMRGQDQSRFAILNLDPFDNPDADPGLDLMLVEEVGRQLLRRMIDGFDRWRPTLMLFKEALMKIGGHDPRGGEQFGALLTAAHIAEHDEAPTPAMLREWALRLAAPKMQETANKTDDWRECLNHLTDVIPEGLRNKSSALPTLGSRLAAFRRDDGRSVVPLDDLRAICTMMGLAVSFPKKEPQTWANARLFIPGSHPETRKQFMGTTWEGVPGATGVWANTLQRCPDPETIWTGSSGAGLDKKRWGLFVQLARAFPDLDEADEPYDLAS